MSKYYILAADSLNKPKSMRLYSPYQHVWFRPNTLERTLYITIPTEQDLDKALLLLSLGMSYSEVEETLKQ